MTLSLNQFISAYDGRGVFSPCTGNKGVYLPQCLDLASLWSTNIGEGCFPRRGAAKNVFDNADPAKWRKIRNTPTGVPPERAIVVFGPHPGNPNGHIAVARAGSTRKVLYTFDQNWSIHNRCARERHSYSGDNVIGWLVAR